MRLLMLAACIHCSTASCLLQASACCLTAIPHMSPACRSYGSALFVWRRKVAPEPAKALLLEDLKSV